MLYEVITQKSNGKENLQGFITRQIIEKAMYHGLDHIPIKEYMTTEMATVESDSELAEIQEKIIENKQRILPVVEKDVISGVITRTDLLNVLVRQSRHSDIDSPDLLKDHVHARTRNILKFMKERLSSRIIDILETIGEEAEKIGYDAYVVGGFVRDLFLYRNNEDIDIVIEGDGIEFVITSYSIHYTKLYEL